MVSCPPEQSANRPRGSRSSTRSRSSTAAATPPSARWATRSTSRPTSSGTATRSCAPSCAGAAPARPTGTRRRCATSTPHAPASAGRAPSRSTPPGRWTFTIEAWTDAFASWRRSSTARWRPTSGRPRAASCREGVLLLERVAGLRRGRGPRHARAPRSASSRDTTAPQRTRVEAALALDLVDAAERYPDRLESTILPSRSSSTSTARAPASAPGTSCSRARGAASTACAEQLPRLAELGFDVALPPADPPDRPRPTARAPTTRSSPGPDDPGSPWAIGDASRRPRRDPPRSGHARRLRRLVAEAPARGHRDRPGLRDPVLGRPPVAHRAPRVVQPPPGRDAEVRREPAQEVPGHLQRQLATARTGAALAGAAGRRPASGSTHGVRVFRVDNPHTKPLPFWEWLIRKVRARAPRRRLPGRGVHRAGR